MTETVERATVGRRIGLRLAELERGPTWLAKRIGRHPTTVVGWTSGRHEPPTQLIARIAEVLDVPPGWLFKQPNGA